MIVLAFPASAASSLKVDVNHGRASGQWVYLRAKWNFQQVAGSKFVYYGMGYGNNPPAKSVLSGTATNGSYEWAATGSWSSNPGVINYDNPGFSVWLWIGNDSASAAASTPQRIRLVETITGNVSLAPEILNNVNLDLPTVIIRIDRTTGGVEVTNPMSDPDQDGDGIPDATDPDDDGDGLLDIFDPDHPQYSGISDTDKDGIGDPLDLDDDGDGIPDNHDSDHPDYVGDMDNDGIPNDTDTDRDGDGALNNFDSDPDDPTKYLPDTPPDTTNEPDPPARDTDGDGVPDYVDSDDDNDGQPDTYDPTPKGDGEGGGGSGGGSGGEGGGDGSVPPPEGTGTITGKAAFGSGPNLGNSDPLAGETGNAGAGSSELQGIAGSGQSIGQGEIGSLRDNLGRIRSSAAGIRDKLLNWNPAGGLGTPAGDFQSFQLKMPGLQPVTCNLPLDHPGIPVFRMCCLFAFYLSAMWHVFRILKI